MLTAVSTRTSEASRLVTMRHPNSMPCVAFRKKVKRKDAPEGSMGGSPTLGGLGVLTSEDEDDFEWHLLGDGMVLFVGEFQASSTVDRNDGLAPSNTAEALIELNDAPDGLGSLDGQAPVRFTVEKNDVIYAIPGVDIHLPYEIVDVEGNINVPPYTRRYILNSRDDLDYLEAEIEVTP